MEQQLPNKSNTSEVLSKLLETGLVGNLSSLKLADELSDNDTKHNELILEKTARLVPMSVKKCIEVGIPMSVTVQALKGEESIIMFLEFELVRVQGRINVNAGLGIQGYQLREIAELIFEQFKYESVEDLALAMRKGSNGLYGDIFRIDGAIIVKWIQAYLDEKYQLIESGIRKENTKEKNDEVDYKAFQDRLKTEQLKYNERKEQEARDRLKHSEAVAQSQNLKSYNVQGVIIPARDGQHAQEQYKQAFGKDPETVTLL